MRRARQSTDTKHRYRVVGEPLNVTGEDLDPGALVWLPKHLGDALARSRRCEPAPVTKAEVAASSETPAEAHAAGPVSRESDSTSEGEADEENGARWLLSASERASLSDMERYEAQFERRGDLELMSAAKLRDVARELGLKASGAKRALVERIIEAETKGGD